jgi:hypothetical protein
MNAQKIVNFKSLSNLAPYPLIIPSSEWNKLPEWERAQVEHENSNVRLINKFIVESTDYSTKSIVFRFDFNTPTLLSNTPLSWVISSSRFNIHSDIFNISHIVGESSQLFKLINKTNKFQPSYTAFEKKDLKRFENYLLCMDITLVKTTTINFNNKTYEVQKDKDDKM